MVVPNARVEPRRHLRWLNPIHTYFRRKRIQEFVDLFQPADATTILDVGGTPQNWRLVAAQPQLILLNLPGKQPENLPSNMTAVGGDGCNLQYADKSFDLAFSNSAIEHVGTWDNQKAFASELRRVGRSYYVQTPSKWFPVEPHILTVGVQWLPRKWQYRLIRYTSLVGLVRKVSPAWVDGFLDEVRLLTYGECRTLFPESDIKRERFLGITKSFVISYQGNGAQSKGNSETPE